MIEDFLSPVTNLLQQHQRASNPFCLCQFIETFTEEDHLRHYKLALLGVKENRNTHYQENNNPNPDKVREAFYTLYPGHWKARIVDMGNIQQGATAEDTYFAMQAVCAQLLKRDIIPLIIGGVDMLTYTQYRAYDQLKQTVDLVHIDSRFDIGKSDQPLTSTSYLNRIITSSPQKLFNYYHLGYQTYLIAQPEIDLMSQLNFEYYRLGEIVENLSEAEPIFRNADMVSLDLSAIRLADAPGQAAGSPNGLNGREACTLSRYAGLSNKVSSLGIYEYHADKDLNGQTAQLIAQIIWYFIEGYQIRTLDKPFNDSNDYKKYHVPHPDRDLIFLQSTHTEKWWMELPTLKKNLLKKYYVACSHNDYLKAIQGEIPDRWWKTYKKYL
ncbi:MAG: formimidoylglutamase [Flavobacteriales bacterium AspAUS03]